MVKGTKAASLTASTLPPNLAASSSSATTATATATAAAAGALPPVVTAPLFPATTLTAAAAAAASAPSSPCVVRYAPPALVVEGLGFVLNQEKLVDFYTKTNLLTVSRDVCDTTRSSIVGLLGDEQMLPILGKFSRLRHLSIVFEKRPEGARYQTAGVDLSVVVPLLQCLEVRTQARPDDDGKKKMKKKKMKKKKEGGDGAEVIVLDADEVVDDGEAPAAVAAAAVDDDAEQDGGKSTKKRRSKGDADPKGGKREKKSKTDAKADLEEESDSKPAAAETAVPKAVLEPCTLLTGLRSLRCLTTVKLAFDKGMGAAAENWLEEQLPPSLEDLQIRGRVLLDLGFGPLTRMVRVGRLPRLTSVQLVGRSYGNFYENEFLQPSSPEVTIGVFLELLACLTRATTPRLQKLIFRGGIPPLHDVFDDPDNGGGWLYLLLNKYPTWWAETEALRHWWTGERPIHLQHLQVEDRTDVQAVPKLLKTGDPRLVELGTLLYASVGTGLMYLDELDLECVVALVDQLEEYHSHYARAQAVRALACYVRRDGTYLLSHEHPELYHRARDLLYTLVRVALAAPTGKEGGQPPPDPGLSFLTRHLLDMVSAALVGDENVMLFDLQDVDFEAIAVLAVKVLAFRSPSEAAAQQSALSVLLHILREDLPVRGAWEASMAAMAERGLYATKEEGRKGVYADVATLKTTSGGEGDETAGTVTMIRLLLRMSFGYYVNVPIKPMMETLLLFLSQNVALLFEALRAQCLLAPVVAVLFHDRSTPSLLWICSHLDTPSWVPSFIVDVLLRRIEAPPFKGFGRHLTTALVAGTKKIPAGLLIDPARYDVNTGRVLLLETLLAPERSSAFFAALAGDAKNVGNVTLFNLLKEVASRGLLGPGGVVSAGERQQLGEAVDVLKLAMDASPEALCVLRALKGEPADHLRDVLTRIQVVAVRTKSGKMRPLKGSLFDELLVSLAGLDATSTSAQTLASASSSSVNGTAAPSISSSSAAAAAAAAAAGGGGAAAAVAAAVSASSPLSSLSSHLDATLTQLGEEEVVNRLRDMMEGCKIKRKVNNMGTPLGKQQWKVNQLRILALALSSLTVFSDVFVKMLAGPGIRAVAARQAAAVDAGSAEAVGETEGKVDKKQLSCHPPAPRSTESFLEFWIEVIAALEKLPVLAFGLARAATKDRDVLRGLCMLGAYSGSNVGRLARALALLTTTRAQFPQASTAVAGGGDGGEAAAAATTAAAAAAAALNSEAEDDGDASSTAKGGRGAAIEHPYIRRALTFGVPAVDPATIVDCLRVNEGAVDGHGAAFRLNERTPLLVISLFPAMTTAVLGSEESSVLAVRSDFPVVWMLLQYQRARMASGGRPSLGTSSSSSSSSSSSGSAFFDKSMMEVLIKSRTEAGLEVGKAVMSFLMNEVTAPELIAYKAFRTLRILTLEEPAFALPHVLDIEGILPMEVRVMVFESLQKQPRFATACVERYLPELLEVLDRSVEGKTGVSSLEIVQGIMTSVPDFVSRVAMLLIKEKEENSAESGVGGACVRNLVWQWSRDRRVQRGSNKELIEQFAALLPPTGGGGGGGGGGGEEGDDKEKKEEETAVGRPKRGKK